MKVSATVWFLARIFVGVIFAAAGFSKLIEPAENFRGVITHYEVIPYALVPAIAAILPWLEFIFGVFLLLGYAPRLSAAVLSALSFGFLLVLGASNVLIQHGSYDCGCFGQTGPVHFTVRQIFLLDIINFLIGLKLYSLKGHPFSLDHFLKRAEFKGGV